MELRKFIATTIREYLNENKSNQIWYHGSDYNFNSFENFKSKGPSALGFFATDDKNLAELFGNNVYVVNFNIKNPYKITMNKWDDIRSKHAKDTQFFENMKKDLIEKGHDGISIASRTWKSSNGVEFNDGNIVIVFNKDNINIEALL